MDCFEVLFCLTCADVNIYYSDHSNSHTEETTCVLIGCAAMKSLCDYTREQASVIYLCERNLYLQSVLPDLKVAICFR